VKRKGSTVGNRTVLWSQLNSGSSWVIFCDSERKKKSDGKRDTKDSERKNENRKKGSPVTVNWLIRGKVRNNTDAVTGNSITFIRKGR
jgi:hypothetical protein